MQEIPRHNSDHTPETPFVPIPSDTDPTGSITGNPYANSEITAPGGTPEPPGVSQHTEQGTGKQEIQEIIAADNPLVAAVTPQFEQPLQAMLEGLRDDPLHSDAAFHFGMLAAGDSGEVNEHVFIRFFPAGHHGVPPLTPEQAEQRIIDYGVHTRKLVGDPENPAIILPNTYYQRQDRKNGTARITAITERVHGAKLGKDDFIRTPAGERIPPEHQTAAITIVDTVATYLNWVLDTRPPVFLNDIAKAGQYFVSEDGKPILVDTDPIMGDLSTQEGWFQLDNSLSNLGHIVNSLSDETVRNELRARLADLDGRVDRMLGSKAFRVLPYSTDSIDGMPVPTYGDDSY